MIIPNFQLLLLTGPLKEKSQELKIKDNADHVGHSVLLVLLNHGLFSVENKSIFLNNSLLIVQLPMEITDAMEDGHQTVLNMFKLKDYLLNQNIHMLHKLEHALEIKDHFILAMFFQLQDVMDY